MKLAETLRQKVIDSGKSLIELQHMTGVDRSTLSILKRGGRVSEAVLQKLNDKLLPQVTNGTPRPNAFEVVKSAATVARVMEATQPKTHNGKGTTWYVGSPKVDEWIEYVPKRSRKSTSSLMLSPKGVLTIPRNLVSMYLFYPGQRVSVYYNTAKRTIAIQRNPKGHITLKSHGTDASDTTAVLDLGGLLREQDIKITSHQRVNIQADPTMLIVELP